MIIYFSAVALNNQSYEDERNKVNEKSGGAKTPSSFLKATTTTLLHTIDETERASYVAHINSYLRDDPFLKQFLPLDPSTNALFDLAKGGVLLWYFILELSNLRVSHLIDFSVGNLDDLICYWLFQQAYQCCGAWYNR